MNMFRQIIDELKKKNVKKLDAKMLGKLAKQYHIDPNTFNENWQNFVELLKKSEIILASDLRNANGEFMNNVRKMANLILKQQGITKKSFQLENIADYLNQQYELQVKKFEEEQTKFEVDKQKFEAYKDFMNERIRKLDTATITKIDFILKSFGFKIKEINRVSKTGMHGDFRDLDITQDKINFDGYLEMIGRRKPIDLERFAPKRNQDKANEIVRTISERMDQEGISFSINQYSLDKTDRVLFSMWI